MVNEVKLPITDQVPFHAYQVRGFEAAVLLATDENGEEFFFDTCINCYMRFPHLGEILFDYTCNYSSWFFGQDVFYIQTTQIDCREMSPTELLACVTRYLDHGIYVAGFFNEKYIPHKKAYQKRDFKHGFFLYGYNRAKQLFYAIGYTDHSKFELYPITFSDFVQSVLCLGESVIWLRFRNLDKKLVFDLQSVYDELGDYLRSDYTIHGGIGKHQDDFYGLRAHRAFRYYVTQTGQQGDFLDVRFSRFFFENKVFMLKRLSFLYQKGYINDYSETYTIVAQKSKTVHFLFLKYNMTRNPVVIESIDCLLKEINRMDEEVLSDVYEELAIRITQEKKEVYL